VDELWSKLWVRLPTAGAQLFAAFIDGLRPSRRAAFLGKIVPIALSFPLSTGLVFIIGFFKKEYT
jgi:hypothetical protein